MSSSFYEILELSSGEIVLRRSGDEGSSEPLVTLKFSAESIAFLGAGRFEVAKAMIEAGMEAAGDIAEYSSEDTSAELPDINTTVFH
jgi:hypothetical protein